MNAGGTVVVGIDGSSASREVLEHAVREAARRGARVRVVVAAQLLQRWADPYAALVLPTAADLLADARRDACAVVDEVLSGRTGLGADVPVTVETALGEPGPVLVTAAEGAELLVVGHRRRGAIRSAVLGSVGRYCVLHAGCPVVVVPPVAAVDGHREVGARG